MNPRRKAFAFSILMVCLMLVPLLIAGDDIPKAAWKRPLGAPLENAGKKKTGLEAQHLDDGYWQGAPVGGFGAGTFSRSYRGDFVRWHIKPGVHKYESASGNQSRCSRRLKETQRELQGSSTAATLRAER